MRSRPLAVILLCGAFFVAGRSAHAQTPHAQPSAAAAPAASPAIQVTAALAPAEPTFGEVLTLSVTLTYPAGYRVFFPQNPSVKPFRLLRDHSNTSREETPAGVVEHIDLALLALRTGLAKTAPIEVPFVAPDGQTGTAVVPSQRVVVRGAFALEQAPEPAALPDARPIIERNWPLLIAILVIASTLVAAALTLIGVRMWRRRMERDKARPAIPADVLAFHRLAQLESEGLILRGEFGAVAVRLSEISREYFGLRYGFAGLDMTATECVETLRGVDMPRLSVREVDEFLLTTDLVKFAQRPTDAEEMTGLCGRVRHFVDATRKTREEVDADDASTRAIAGKSPPREALPGLGLRGQAFAFDLALVSTLSTIFAFVARETRLPALFDIGLALPWVALVLRDVPRPGSPGKAFSGLLLRGLDAPSAPIGARVVRNVLMVLPVAGQVAEALALAYLPEARRIGDRIAHTRIVDLQGDATGRPRAVALGPTLVALAVAAALLFVVPFYMLGGRPTP